MNTDWLKTEDLFHTKEKTLKSKHVCIICPIRPQRDEADDLDVSFQDDCPQTSRGKQVRGYTKAIRLIVRKFSW